MLRENWPEKGLFGKVGKELNKIARMLNGMEGYNGVQVFKNDRGIDVYGGGSSLNLALFTFGIKAQKSKPFHELTLNPGIVTMGNVRTAINETKVKLVGSPAIVILQVTRASRSAAWMPSTVSAIPANNSTHFFVPYYEYALNPAGVSYSLIRIHRLMNFEVL